MRPSNPLRLARRRLGNTRAAYTAKLLCGTTVQLRNSLVGTKVCNKDNTAEAHAPGGWCWERHTREVRSMTEEPLCLSGQNIKGYRSVSFYYAKAIYVLLEDNERLTSARGRRTAAESPNKQPKQRFEHPSRRSVPNIRPRLTVTMVAKSCA